LVCRCAETNVNRKHIAEIQSLTTAAHGNGRWIFSFMSEIQRESKGKFKALPTKPLRDKNISFKARGLYAMVMSMPDNWKGQVYHLVDQSEKDGEKAVKSALKELVDNGYCQLRCYPKIEGKFQGKYYMFFESKTKLKTF